MKDPEVASPKGQRVFTKTRGGNVADWERVYEWLEPEPEGCTRRDSAW